MLSNKWRKLGILLQPCNDIWWMSHFCGPTFAEVHNDRISLYVVGRDSLGISRIGLVELELDNPFSIISISSDPVLDIGEVGCFDENGVSYPWLVRQDDRVLLYYVGWQQGGRGGFQTNIGLAEYNKTTSVFERVSRAPILPRINEEPICTGSLAVRHSDGKWTMWYTCFERWMPLTAGGYQHFYLIKESQSYDGVNWERPGRVVLPFSSPKEYVICKPMILEEEGVMRMWFSSRGEYYRIGYAEATDGKNWVRKSESFEWDNSDSTIDGFDDVMQEYAFIFDAKGRRYMTYNGNGYGKTGVGLALAV